MNLSEIKPQDDEMNKNKQNLYEFNPSGFNPDQSDLYPSLTSIIKQDNTTNFNFQFEENEGDKNNKINFDFNKDEFNFDG